MEAGRERRKDVRLPVRLSCQVDLAGRTLPAVVRNVSAGGLSIQLEPEVDQGDNLRISIETRGSRGPVVIEAIAWHIRRVRDRKSGKESTILGMVLSSAGDDYAELVASSQPRSAFGSIPRPSPTARGAGPAPNPTPKPRPAAHEAEPLPKQEDQRRLPKPARFRIRVTRKGSPRTRSIVAFGQDEAEARATALAEAGPDWEILEVEPS